MHDIFHLSLESAAGTGTLLPIVGAHCSAESTVALKEGDTTLTPVGAEFQRKQRDADETFVNNFSMMMSKEQINTGALARSAQVAA
jgi:hypothetical protein